MFFSIIIFTSWNCGLPAGGTDWLAGQHFTHTDINALTHTQVSSYTTQKHSDSFEASHR